MRRRGFIGLMAGAVFTVLTAKVPVFAVEWPEMAQAADTYTPLTDDQIAEMVAGAVRNTSYQCNWGRPVERCHAPVGRLRHTFTERAPWESERAVSWAEYPQLTEARRIALANTD